MADSRPRFCVVVFVAALIAGSVLVAWQTIPDADALLKIEGLTQEIQQLKHRELIMTAQLRAHLGSEQQIKKVSEEVPATLIAMATTTKDLITGLPSVSSVDNSSIDNVMPFDDIIKMPFDDTTPAPIGEKPAAAMQKPAATAKQPAAAMKVVEEPAPAVDTNAKDLRANATSDRANAITEGANATTDRANATTDRANATRKGASNASNTSKTRVTQATVLRYMKPEKVHEVRADPRSDPKALASALAWTRKREAKIQRQALED